MKRLFLVMAVLLAGLVSGCGFGGDDEGSNGGNVDVHITVAATPTSIVAGASSVIVATVTNTEGEPVQGQRVTFSVRENRSGGTLIDEHKTTDAAGKAIITYTAGNNDSALNIDDVVSASISGSDNSVIIKRLPAKGTGNRIISFIEDPETSPDGPIGPPWKDVVMKVKVTTDDLVTPVVGETVTFSIVEGEGLLTNPDYGEEKSDIPDATDVTDDNGEAWVLFTRPNTGTDDTVVRAKIDHTNNGGDTARVVYWTDDCFVHTCCGQ